MIIRKSAYIYLLAMLVIGIGNPVRAQEQKPVGQATMTFLEIDVGARAVGMGGSFNCVDDDASALFWNPAGISRLRGMRLSLNHTKWLADMDQYAVAATIGNAGLGTFGFSVMLMDNGDFHRTRPVPADLTTNPEGYILEGTYNVNQYVAGIAYSRQITDRFAFGAQLKYVYQDLGTADVMVQRSIEETDIIEDKKNEAGALAFDFGTIFYPGLKDLRIAMSFRHFSHRVKYAYESYDLPLTFTLGIAGDLLSMLGYEGSNHVLIAALDAVHPRDYTERIHLGLEYKYANTLFLRGGYKFNYDEEGFTMGVGMKVKRIGFDFAYTPFADVFGPVQRLSICFAF
jgi:long-subunit fatty acid transport protein